MNMNKMISKLEKMSGIFKIKEHTSEETMEGESEDLINAIKLLEEVFEDLGTDYSFDIESMIIKLQKSTMRQMKEYEGNFAMQVKLQNYHNDAILNIISLNK